MRFVAMAAVLVGWAVISLMILLFGSFAADSATSATRASIIVYGLIVALLIAAIIMCVRLW